MSLVFAVMELVAIASLNRKPVITAREMAIAHPRKNGGTIFGVNSKKQFDCEIVMMGTEHHLCHALLAFEKSNFEEQTGYQNVNEWYTAKCLIGDPSDNEPGVQGFGKKTVQKYLKDPGYILTDKEHKIFQRNADIFCLDKYNELPEEKEYYKEQLEVKVDPCYKTFLKYCEEHSFKRILDKKEDWHNLFFIKTLYN